MGETVGNACAVRGQRRRSAGWRMPPRAKYVGRPGEFGNPFVVGTTTPDDWEPPFAGVLVRGRAHAVELLRAYLDWRARQPAGWSSLKGPRFPSVEEICAVVDGFDYLLCWCPAAGPCHVDVLLETAAAARRLLVEH